MRVFLAIELSDEVRANLAELQEALKPQLPAARFVRPANIHLTVRFLGEIERSAVDAFAGALPARLSELTRFPLTFRGVGCFPNARRPRIVWVGVQAVPSDLAEAHAAAEQSACAVGCEPEARPFQPHLTIARVKIRGSGRLARTLDTEALARGVFGTVDVADLVLFESRLSENGAIYRPISRFPLGGTIREQLV